MKKNLLKKIKETAYPIGVMVVALIFVSVFATAQGGSVTNITVAEGGTLNQYFSEGDGLSFGAITQDKSRFDHGIEILAEGLDITGGDLDVDVASDFSSTVNISATTTIPRLDASSQTALNFQANATTTAGGATANEIVLATVQNTGNDLLCTDVWADVSAGTDLFSYTIRVGSSTTATSSLGEFITLDQEVEAERIGTSTEDTLSKEDDEGTITTDVWTWRAGYYITATMTFDPTGATSSASFTTAGGNAGVGNLHVNCKTRY